MKRRDFLKMVGIAVFCPMQLPEKTPAENLCGAFIENKDFTEWSSDERFWDGEDVTDFNLIFNPIPENLKHTSFFLDNKLLFNDGGSESYEVVK